MVIKLEDIMKQDMIAARELVDYLELTEYGIQAAVKVEDQAMFWNTRKDYLMKTYGQYFPNGEVDLISLYREVNYGKK